MPGQDKARMSLKKENPRRAYRSLLQRSVPQFLDTLSNNIIQGPARRQDALLQLDLVQAHDLADVLDKFRLHGDESLLQLAAVFHGDVEVMCRLASLCPRLLLLQRQGDYEGQTVLHTLVAKENVPATSAILNHPSLPEPWVLLNGKAVGPRFRATVMMGELPLSVAALTFNLEMVDALLDKGAKLHAVNSLGDTVLHSLVRFSHHYPEKENDVLAMIREVHSRLQSPTSSPSPQADPQSVWLVENGEGLTVLRLAATLAQPAIFRYVLQLKAVYCQIDQHDGLFDSLLYDVTEIDPVARRRWLWLKHRGSGRKHGVSPHNAQGLAVSRDRLMDEPGCCCCLDTFSTSSASSTSSSATPYFFRQDGGRSVSVLEIICETGRVEKAFQILSTYVVRSIVKSKWKHYRLWFVGWGVLHLLLMTLLTAYAVYKARLVSGNSRSSESQPSANTPTSVSAEGSHSGREQERQFVDVVAALTIPLSLVMMVWEGVRVWRKQPLHLWLIHHNGLYRLQLVIFAVSLLVDTFWYWAAGPVNNILLTLALLLGWWFTTFFLRPWHKFSFFTVMLQKVLLGDMLRFSTIILLELLAFSVAMYITFLATPGPLPEDFEHLGAAVMTMFQLMLGLTEVEVLNKASQPWLAITLFVLFVLLTYVLLLNALIAMMSNTCSLVAEDKVSQWELQRLSVVLMLESMLPSQCLMYNSGRPMHVARFDLRRKQTVQEVRFFTKVTSVQTSYTDGAAILKRKSMMQTQRFDDVHAIMASAGDAGHIDLLASFTHQQAVLSGYHQQEDSKGDLSLQHFSDPALYVPDTYGLHKGSHREKHGGGGPYSALSAIREEPDKGWQSRDERVGSQDQGHNQGLNSTNYISVRQSLLQAWRAAQFARHLHSAQRQRLDGKTVTGAGQHVQEIEPGSADRSHNPSSSDITAQSPLPGTIPGSPHTPKSVILADTQPSPSVSPRVRRKRHSSERGPSGKARSVRLLDNKFKTLHFPSEQPAEELPSLRFSEEEQQQQLEGDTPQSLAARSVMASERRPPTQVQPLPSPDVFTISHNSPNTSYDA